MWIRKRRYHLNLNHNRWQYTKPHAKFEAVLDPYNTNKYHQTTQKNHGRGELNMSLFYTILNVFWSFIAELGFYQQSGQMWPIDGQEDIWVGVCLKLYWSHYHPNLVFKMWMEETSGHNIFWNLHWAPFKICGLSENVRLADDDDELGKGRKQWDCQ